MLQFHLQLLAHMVALIKNVSRGDKTLIAVNSSLSGKKRKHKTKTSNAERRERKVSSLKAQLEAAETRLSDIMGEVREANVGVDTALKVLEAIRSRATRVEREFDRNNARLKTVKVACRKSNSAANKSADAIWSDARARVPLAADVAPP